MDFRLTEEQELLRRSVREFAETGTSPNTSQRKSFPRSDLSD